MSDSVSSIIRKALTRLSKGPKQYGSATLVGMPEEIGAQICEHLASGDGQALSRLSRTCRKYHRIAHDFGLHEVDLTTIENMLSFTAMLVYTPGLDTSLVEEGTQELLERHKRTWQAHPAGRIYSDPQGEPRVTQARHAGSLVFSIRTIQWSDNITLTLGRLIPSLREVRVEVETHSETGIKLDSLAHFPQVSALYTRYTTKENGQREFPTKSSWIVSDLAFRRDAIEITARFSRHYVARSVRVTHDSPPSPTSSPDVEFTVRYRPNRFHREKQDGPLTVQRFGRGRSPSVVPWAIYQSCAATELYDIDSKGVLELFTSPGPMPQGPAGEPAPARHVEMLSLLNHESLKEKEEARRRSETFVGPRNW